jgi:hypothetical protein
MSEAWLRRLKIAGLVVILLTWLGWDLWISFNTMVTLVCHRCWEKSLAANIFFFVVHVGFCTLVWKKWSSKLVALFLGLIIVSFLAFETEADSVVLALFINPGPYLYQSIKESCPDKMSTLMDTNFIDQFAHKAYIQDIRRWQKKNRLGLLGCEKK